MTIGDVGRAKDFANVYAQVCALTRGISQAFVSKNGCEAQVVYSQTDLRNQRSRAYVSAFRLSAATGERKDGSPLGFPVETSNVLMRSPSPSGQSMAMICSIEGEKDKFLIEVWDQIGLKISIPTEDTHGQVYKDNTFGCLSWSPDERFLVYTAEAKAPPTRTYWEPEKPSTDGGPSKDKRKPGIEYEYKEDWGEQFVGRRLARLYVADLKTKTIEIVKGVAEDVAVGDAVWTPDGRGLAFSGFPIQDRRLGLIYCYNRACHIYFIPYSPSSPSSSSAGGDEVKGGEAMETDDTTVTAVCLTPNLPHAHSPRFSPDGRTLVFVATEPCITHSTCFKLVSIAWCGSAPTGAVRTVVDVVQESSNVDEFPGIYTHALPQRCWSSNSRFVYLGSAWRSLNVALRVDVESGEVTRMNHSALGEGSINVLDVHSDIVMAVYSAPDTPPFVCYTHVSDDLDDQFTGTWYTLGKPDRVPIAFEVIQVPVTDASGDSDFECVLHYPERAAGEGMPLIVVPHGGPHGVFAADWKASMAFLNMLGYAVCQVNYRGSTGYGLKPLESLLGRIGTQDVADVFAAVDIVCKNSPNIDSSRIGYSGGSHGGFLGAHCIVQKPEVFAAAILRNPVINLVEEATTADIPDWVYAEGGVSYKTFPIRDDLEPLFDKSPIAYDMARVKTPTMFHIGAKDRRVPPSQGFQMYHALKSHGVDTKLYLYPDDCHPLDSVRTAGDSWVNAALWFDKYLG